MPPGKTLVILTPGFPKDEKDSTCLPLQQNLVKSIQRNYPDIELVVLSFQYPYTREMYSWQGIKIFCFNGQNKGGLKRLLLRRHVYERLKQLYHSKKIVGLLSFWYGECAATAEVFAHKFNVRHYCWILGQDARKGNGYPARIKLPGRKLLAVSDFIQDEFHFNHSVRPARVLNPGIDPKQFTNAQSARNIDLLAVGSLIPLKQFDLVPLVVAGLKDPFADIRACIVGTGPERDRIENKIRESGLEKNITLTGEMGYTGVLDLMRRSKILLHPSSYEGFGMVMIEALHASCHVISFCKPSKGHWPQWHIVRTVEEMTAKAASLLANPSTTYECITYATIEDTASQLLQLFESTETIPV
jgi:glycosyltransferase involved in cell wall biosynthesis